MVHLNLVKKTLNSWASINYIMQMRKMSSLFSISERRVSQKGSGALVIAGLIILIVGVGVGLSAESDAVAFTCERCDR